MKPTTTSTVMEFFYPGGFACSSPLLLPLRSSPSTFSLLFPAPFLNLRHLPISDDYEFTTRGLGMAHYGFHGSACVQTLFPLLNPPLFSLRSVLVLTLFPSLFLFFALVARLQPLHLP